MNALVLRLKAPLSQRLDLSALTACKPGNQKLAEVEKLAINISGRPQCLGDVFDVRGPTGETIILEGGSDRLDFVGAGLDGGRLIVEGDVGAYAGRGIKNGCLSIRGHAGPWLASGLIGGTIFVSGSAGAHVGGIRPGERFGMRGGFVVIEGDIAERAGDRMRRGIIATRGRCGPFAGSRMVGGTLIAARGFGEDAGVLLRRGTLIGPSIARQLPTFVDCGDHELSFLPLLERCFAAAVGRHAIKFAVGPVRRLQGDMATIGKGEILLTTVALN
jgi:formylmethanofuran dehydrogenase subunit C